MMTRTPHFESAGRVSFTVDGYPERWHVWSFGAKVSWLQGHTRPRASYGQACALLRDHGRARAAAKKERRECRGRERENAPRS